MKAQICVPLVAAEIPLAAFSLISYKEICTNRDLYVHENMW